MKKRTLYLYAKEHNYDDFISFLKMDTRLYLVSKENDLLELITNDEYSYDDFCKLRELIMEELLIDFVGFIVPYAFDISKDDLKLVFKRINYGIYRIEDFIIEVCLGNDLNLQKRLKSYYYNLIGHENLNTVLSFIEYSFNASLTAKKLYLHRNTLNYRLDLFVSKSEMDVRSFTTGLALYLLFRR